LKELLTLLANSLFIWGVYYAFLPGMIFGNIGDWMEYNLPDWVNKPVFTCTLCMSSVWGWGYWTLGYEWYYYPMYVVILCGLNGWIKSKVE